MLTLSDFQTFLTPCILSAADNADWCRKTRTAVSQLSLLLKHHIIAVTFCLPPRRAVLRSLVPPLTPTYTKVYATSCYCSQSRDILGYVLSLLCTRTGAFFPPPQCNDRFAKKYVTPASLKMSQVVDLCSGHWGQLPEKRWTLAITCYWAIIEFLHYR